MPLLLTVRNPTSIPIEVDAVQPAIVREQSADEVLRTIVQYGNRKEPLGEFFEARGSAADDETIVWRGDCSKVKLIGALMERGTVRVEGDAGMHVGAEMTGGSIVVEGNASDWVGAELKGGRIVVQGSAGHLVGAVYRGGRRGMTGGEILIHGDAGNEVGHSMRRGLIAVGGSCNDVPGYDMIAGSILMGHLRGIRPGAGMRRGTIAVLGEEPRGEFLPTFRRVGAFQPTFLQLYLRHLRSLEFPLPAGCFEASYDRYCGDFLEYGKGEIFVRNAA